MLRRTILAAVVACFALTQPAAAVPVDELHGSVSDQTYPAFDRFVSEHLDKVIGLKIAVEGISNKTISVSAHDGQFVIYRKANTNTEIVASSGFNWQHGSYVFDGFFVVKSGGMHQGVVSYGLEPVAEATVRLAPNVNIRPVTLR